MRNPSRFASNTVDGFRYALPILRANAVRGAAGGAGVTDGALRSRSGRLSAARNHANPGPLSTAVVGVGPGAWRRDALGVANREGYACFVEPPYGTSLKSS
nr:hypothetical protein BDOA9_0129620 [Bradyrhizobium sp. DOA9]